MKELKPRIHENGMDYVLVGDYYVPDLKLPKEHRPIGHWGRLHQSYLKQFRPMVYSVTLRWLRLPARWRLPVWKRNLSISVQRRSAAASDAANAGRQSAAFLTTIL